jgi:serine/threonine protein kinase/rhamnogalacturonyl hydrolase YesR
MADFNFSIFAPTGDSVAGSALLEVVNEALRATGEIARWTVKADGFWTYAAPAEQLQCAQGWKLHVSATPLSAETVLARSLPVLLKSSSSFKFASTVDHVAILNTRTTPRGYSGKFITIYPENDEEAVRIAAALHQETKGLAGPRILSDRPYAPESLVHYRYGAFVEDRRVTNDGFYAWVIYDPDGNPVEDRRVGEYLPPTWARCPFPEPAVAATTRSTSTSATAKNGAGGVLIGDRFLVREAIRHSNRGGVYRAVDNDSGAEAVIKEARPHVAEDATGKDARDLLRAEARALEKISPLGVAPRLLKLFEQGGHLFLAEDLVPGVDLRQWVPGQMRLSGWRRYLPKAVEMASRLVELMDVVHGGGVILRDFNPNNIMVLPDGQLRLIDVELSVNAAAQVAKTSPVGTAGYAAPEQFEGFGCQPAVQADYFSLGATICYVVTGDTPFLMAEEPKDRPLRERLAEWLKVRGDVLVIPADLQSLILGLMDDDPERRWTTVAARQALSTIQTLPARTPLVSPPPADGSGSTPARLGEEQWKRSVEGIVSYLLAAMKPTDSERLWPMSCAYGAPDPCTVQHGAGGILGALTSYLDLTGDQRVADGIATTGSWIDQRLQTGGTRPAGLYFGTAGIAWSLYEAGRVLGDDRLAKQGLTLASTLPVSAASPDVTHGTSGIGLTFLHLWLRTGNEEFAERANASADALIASVEDSKSGVSWGTPADVDSKLAGRRYYGFAHGTAGVGTFLLAAALATGRSDYLALATRVGETLLGKAIVADGAAQWGAGADDPPTAPYWCHGASGIGSFLTRLHRASGDDRFGKAAHMAVQAVMENAGRGVLGQCHGLAGNGDFLLDVADGVDGQQYEALAHQLARVIYASHTNRQGLVVFPDEYGNPSATWGDGMSGVLAFLLRLRYRSARLWMVDPPLDRGQRP